MHVLIATDAWHPQVNGVVRSLEAVAEAARKLGARVEFLTPQGLRSIPMPSYPEIRLSLITWRMAMQAISRSRADHIHIATEGPIGMAVRRACIKLGMPFTTCYHTRYPEYIAARWPLPLAWSYAWLRRFHNAGTGTMVATQSVSDELHKHGFTNLMNWSRGVDQTLFHANYPCVLDLPRPIFINAGRVAVEKNIDAFLGLDLPGSKVVVGEGPARPSLQQRFPQAHFLGLQSPEKLAALYASSDVLVFPSRTDTFGNVIVEAMACGLPVAAFPVAGPLDIIGNSGAGVMDEDLRTACLAALKIPADVPLAYSQNFTWPASAEQFLQNIDQARGPVFMSRSRKQRKFLANRQSVQS